MPGAARDDDDSRHFVAASRAMYCAEIRVPPLILELTAELLSCRQNRRFEAAVVGPHGMRPGQILPNNDRARLNGQFSRLELIVAERDGGSQRLLACLVEDSRRW